MAGLKNVRDLGLDAVMSSAIEVTPVTPIAHTSPAAVMPSNEVASIESKGKETAETESSPPIPRDIKTKKNRSKLAPTWKQTGLCLSDSTMMKLRLESIKTGKTMSEITETILVKHLPHNRIAI